MQTVDELLKESIQDLREKFVTRSHRVPKGFLQALECDTRSGARELARHIRLRQKKNRAEGQRLRNLLRYECELWQQGLKLIAGVDEAGMSPLAGPVVAGAVILPSGYKLKGLNDSKKILEESRREELEEQIKREAISFSTGRAEVEEIDTINIYHAGLLAMRRAVEGLHLSPEYILVDARKIPQCEIPQRGIIHGDMLSASIAAASILAKTERDRVMREFDKEFPGYGFSQHKGYGTPKHYEMLKTLGVTPLHRRSFRPVRIIMGIEPVQTELFETEIARSAYH